MPSVPPHAAVSPPRLAGGVPLLGHGLEYNRDPLAFFVRCAREADVVQVRFPGAPVYVLSAPEHIEHVLVKQARNYPKDAFQKRALGVVGNGLLVSEGDFWLRQRRMMQPAFHRERVAGYGKMMVARTEEWASRRRDGESIDAFAEMMALTLDVVAGALFGTRMTEQARDVGHAMEAVMLYAKALFENPVTLPLWVPTPGNRRFRAAMATLHAVADGVVEERRRQGTAGEDLLGLMLEAQAEDGARMTDAQLRDESLTLMLAGHETTAVTLTFCLLLLSRHPDVEAELRRELEAVLGRRAPAVEDLPALPFTEQVVKEAMRLYPPVWGMSRATAEADRIGGFHIPARAMVAWSQWALHRDARFFPEPEAFRPQRWAQGLERTLPRFAYFPFGGGPRLCIGAGFAMMEARLLLATLLQRFRFEAAPGPGPELMPSITLRPRHGLPMTLRAA